jgi:predicted unusual protein kinase regulating ubiquinone biosynthesis (AarF/ABC1/UbiB family)
MPTPRARGRPDAALRRYRHASLGEIARPLLQGVAHTSTQHGVRLPASLVLTGKALAQMQLAATELDPELDPSRSSGAS